MRKAEDSNKQLNGTTGTRRLEVKSIGITLLLFISSGYDNLSEHMKATNVVLKSENISEFFFPV